MPRLTEIVFLYELINCFSLFKNPLSGPTNAYIFLSSNLIVFIIFFIELLPVRSSQKKINELLFCNSSKISFKDLILCIFGKSSLSNRFWSYKKPFKKHNMCLKILSITFLKMKFYYFCMILSSDFAKFKQTWIIHNDANGIKIQIYGVRGDSDNRSDGVG